MPLPFRTADLFKAVEQGRVTCRAHPTLPYYIYNYTPEVQYANDWDEVTMNCRGLILDDQNLIVARPWKKFFNLGQVDLPIQFDTPVEVMDKVDGSLGILYPGHDPGDFYLATRGSFESEQAYVANDIWLKNYHAYYDDMPEQQYFNEYTLLFEIIYPQNRIVLDYGDMRDLILLGAVSKQEGYYISPSAAANMFAWPGPVVETMPYSSISEALSHTNRPNAEGFVIRSHNFMVKVKQPDYLELHKLITNVSPKTVWEQLKNGKTKEQIVSVFPDEFHDYVGSMVDPLMEKYMDRLDEIFNGYMEATGKLTKQGIYPEDRKSYALEFRKYKDAKYYFLMLDDQLVGPVLWKELKPKEVVV